MSGSFKNLKNSLIKFLQDEARKTGLKSAVLGISGGVDSAVVSVLAKEAFGDDLLGVMMPSQYSSKESLSHAKELCEKFYIKYEIRPIKDIVNAYAKDVKMDDMRSGNFSARMRMSILYDISAREKAAVIGTSNKSELLLGYGTIFGDLACAVNPIGDIYKTEIFEFADFMGVPKSIIEKPPSADLWYGQSDEDDLGFSYSDIDKALHEYADNGSNKDELIKKGYKEDLCDMIISRIKNNEFKRRLPVIANLSDIK